MRMLRADAAHAAGSLRGGDDVEVSTFSAWVSFMQCNKEQSSRGLLTWPKPRSRDRFAAPFLAEPVPGVGANLPCTSLVFGSMSQEAYHLII